MHSATPRPPPSYTTYSFEDKEPPPIAMASNHSLKIILAICTLACSIGFSEGLTATHVSCSQPTCTLLDLTVAVDVTLSTCRNAVSHSCGQCSSGPGQALLLALDVTADIRVAIGTWLTPTFNNCRNSVGSLQVLVQLVNGVCDLLANVLTLVLSLNLVVLVVGLVELVLALVVSLVAAVLNILLGLCNTDPHCSPTSNLLQIVINLILTVVTGCFH